MAKWTSQSLEICHQTRFGALQPWSAPKRGLSNCQTSLWRTPRRLALAHSNLGVRQSELWSTHKLASWRARAPGVLAPLAYPLPLPTTKNYEWDSDLACVPGQANLAFGHFDLSPHPQTQRRFGALRLVPHYPVGTSLECAKASFTRDRCDFFCFYSMDVKNRRNITFLQ